MSNLTARRTDGQTGGRPIHGAAAALAALLTAWPSVRLSAQVGHDPEHSPFQDVTTRQTFTPFVSRFFGNRTHAGVGAQAALAVGGRFATALSGPLELTATVAVINSKRNVVDPSLPDSTRVSGPIEYRLISADVGLALNLAGARRFHGLAPYLGAAFGVVAPNRSQTDPGGYRANSNITFVPTIGTRARLARAVSLTVELRDNIMRYEWPSKYFFPTDANGNPISPPVLDPATEKDTQTTHNFTLSAGVSLHFTF